MLCHNEHIKPFIDQEKEKVMEKAYKMEFATEKAGGLSLSCCGVSKTEPLHSFGPAQKPYYLIHYILRGKGRFSLGGREFQLEEGNGFLIPPEDLAFYQADDKEPWTYIWIGFDGEGADRLLQEIGLSVRNPVFTSGNGDELYRTVKDMLEHNTYGTANELRRNGQLQVFLSLIAQEVIREEKGEPDKADHYVERAIAYIRSNYCNPVKVTDVADYVCVNRSYLYTLFKNALGMSPQQFLANYRIHKAMELLRTTELPIESVALSCGYQDPLVFTKAFKHIKKRSPSVYRKEIRENQSHRNQDYLKQLEGALLLKGGAMMKEKLLAKFGEIFGDTEGAKVFFAPGRVNLIGEHTDYNGGHVFPCALTIGTYAVARKRTDRALRFYSMNFDQLGMIGSSLDGLKPEKEADWTNYPKGVMWAFGEKGFEIPSGMDLLLYGNIPNGSGLSSSASVEVLTGYILRDFFGFEVSNQDLALIGQFSENHFNGVNCGIMDQFAIAMGKENHAIFLDTADLSYTYAPVKLEGAKIVISCSNKKRGLGDSKYNERRSECETALAELQKVTDIKSLGELSEADFEKYQTAIGDEVRRKRAKHAVYENQRTLQAVAALQANDITRFGQLMNASHVSLRDDYEVTGIELDTLVEEAWKVDGVIGSRMTGAGFGGCTVSLVKDDAIEAFIRQVGEAYERKIGYAADFYVVEIGDGPCAL